MPDIIVDTYKLGWYAQRIEAVNTRLDRLDRRLNILYTKVGLQGLFNLIQADALTGYSWRLTRCKNYLQQTVDDFEITERGLANMDPSNFNLFSIVKWYATVGPEHKHWDFDKIKRPRFIHGVVEYGGAESAIPVIFGEVWSAFWNKELEVKDKITFWSKQSEDGEDFIDFLSGERSSSVKPEYGSYKEKDAFGKIKQNEKKDPKKQVNPDEKWYDKKGTIIEGTAEAKVEGSVLHGHAAGENDWAKGSVDGKFLTGEAHVEASMGLYVYTKDENGKVKKILSPGVSAEVGASAAVVDVSAEGRIGLGKDKNMLGVYGDVGAELLSAEGEAKIAVNRNEVYVGASAEANLAKATASGGVSVLGTDLGVTGSVKVGIGAHAQAGYTDGKLKVDIGVALGVGADLGFEVDVSGTVDAVCDFTSNAWEGVTDFADDASDAISDLWNSWF